MEDDVVETRYSEACEYDPLAALVARLDALEGLLKESLRFRWKYRALDVRLREAMDAICDTVNAHVALKAHVAALNGGQTHES